jgi:hypothetical protein
MLKRLAGHLVDPARVRVEEIRGVLGTHLIEPDERCGCGVVEGEQRIEVVDVGSDEVGDRS